MARASGVTGADSDGSQFVLVLVLMLDIVDAFFGLLDALARRLR